MFEQLAIEVFPYVCALVGAFLLVELGMDWMKWRMKDDE